MPPIDDRPYPLHRVLAEEYQHLHGDALPPGYPAPEPDGAEPDAAREAEHVRAFYAALCESAAAGDDAHRVRHAALCLSGGGIRSATFCLGILQGLARHGWLRHFHYLSTVSGGGYIGSWLSAWINRAGRDAVLAELPKPYGMQPAQPADPLTPEPEPIRHLRAYSNYWTPKVGFFSADTWTVIAAYLRNIVLNWLMLIPIFLAAALVPRIWLKVVAVTPASRWHSEPFEQAVLLFGTTAAVVGIVYIALNLPSMKADTRGQSFLQRQDGEEGFFAWCLLPLWLSAICLVTFWRSQVSHDHFDRSAYRAPFVLFGLIVHVAGTLPYFMGLFAKSISRASMLKCATYFFIVAAVGSFGGYLAWEVSRWVPNDPVAYVVVAAPALLLVFMSAGIVLIGASSHLTNDEDREWWARSSAWILIALVAWTAISALVLYGPILLARIPGLSEYQVWLEIITAITTILSGFAAASAASNAGAPAQPGAPANGGAWGPERMLAVLGPYFVIAFIVALSVLTTEILYAVIPEGMGIPANLPRTPDLHRAVMLGASGASLVILFTVLATVPMAVAFAINVNKFSMHAVYRNRLVLAYLAASHKPRTPIGLTGFDDHDNVPMWTLRGRGLAARVEGKPHRVALDMLHTDPAFQNPAERQQPLHIINAALNLSDSKNLAWQERKASSFTFSPLHVGNPEVRYRPAEKYGHDIYRAVSLGTAMAISGAAASPNSGYHSSSAVTFLMTLFNLRLGWWLGNPRDGAWQRASPRWALKPLFNEAFGRTNDTSDYINVSDGGHFENLGIYEMVVRRCRFIVAIDAGEDGRFTFEDLGNAIRKVRIDLGVHIEMIGRVRILPRDPRNPQDMPKYCAVGRIRYSQIDGGAPASDGTLIYIKPTLCSEDTPEPMDVINYANMQQAFPHDPTMTDQWFSESQFESYRQLGSHVIEQIWSTPLNGVPPPAVGSLDELEMKTNAYLQTVRDLSREVRVTHPVIVNIPDVIRTQ